MGQNSSAASDVRVRHSILEGVTRRTEARCGKLSVSGRYHVLPRRLEDDYIRKDKLLGTGFNGDVYEVQEKHSLSVYAVKTLKLTGLSASKRKELEAECEIFLSMDHPHVVRLVDVYEVNDCLQLVMECMRGGELFYRVKQKKKFSDKEASEAVYQMLMAVNYIHQHDIVHRDLKLENFLYESSTSSHLKLIDFGFSKICKPKTQMTESLGTMSYVAPEVLGRNYTSQCDMWSLGVICFILVAGYMPFSGTDESMRKAIRSGKYDMREHKWRGVSKEAKDFVNSLLVVDPDVRLTAAKALNHPWITKYQKSPTLGSQMNISVVDAMRRFAQAPAIRRACMSVAAWCLACEDDAKVRNAFLEMDRNHDGKVTISELQQFLYGKVSMQDSDVRAAFKALDVNHTEEIDYSEFLAAMMGSPELLLTEQHLQQIFRRLDKDSSGYITRSNLQDLIGDSFDGRSVEQMMQEVDVSPSQGISCLQFIDLMTGANASTQQRRQPLSTRVRSDLSESRTSVGTQSSFRSALTSSPTCLPSSLMTSSRRSNQCAPVCSVQ